MSRIGSRAAAASLACWLIAVSASPTFADGVADEADLQFTVGADAYSKGDFTGALQHFLASNRLVPNRNVMFNIARAYEQLNRFPDAYRYYVDAGRGEAVDAKLKNDVAGALGRIGPRVAVVAVETVPTGATVFLDRRDLGSVGTSPAQLGLKAGTYTILVELAGYEPQKVEKVAGTIGETKSLKLELVRITGKAELSGPPGTAVRIDDERGEIACSLPCTLDLAPGPHIAYFERSGFTVAPQTFTIEPRKSIQANASSVAVVGSLLVSADESNALIEIDGKAFGFTPAVIPNVPIGKRTVRVSLRGYQPIERVIEIRTNTQTDLRDLRMTPERSISAASRQNENIDDAPASITVISSQELEAFGYPTILEALRGVRGFAVNFDSIYGSASVRGLGQANDFSNRLLVLSDGAVLNENILYQPFIHYDGRVDLGDVERIEIVRGPSSVLYGTGAVSGVVNLVMKGRDEPESIHGQVSSYDNSTSRARVGFVERFNKYSGVWASAAGANSQGRDVPLLFDAGSGEVTSNVTSAFDKFHAYTLTSKAWYRDLTLQVFGTSRENSIPTGNYSSRFNDSRNYGNDGRFLAELKLDRALSSKVNLLLRAHYNYAYYHLDYQYDADVPGETYNYEETYRSAWQGAEARLTFTLAKGLTLAIGADAVVHTKVQMRAGNIEDGMLVAALDVQSPYQVVAGSALLGYKPSKRLSFQAGVRFDYWNLKGNQNALPGEDNGATTFPALAPRFAVIYKPDDANIVKLMAGSAFRAPSAYEYFYNDGGTTQVTSSTCGASLSPENVYSLEAEATHRFNPDWVGLVSAHGTLARDVIETVPVGDACAASSGAAPDAIYYRNATVDQRMLGVDFEARRELRAGIMASAQYGYLLGRYVSSPTSDPSQPQSRVLPNAPAQYAGFKVMVPIVQNALGVALRGALEDRRRIDISVTDRSERAFVADAVVSGLVARYQVRYSVGVYNLLNWRYSLPAQPYASSLMPQNGRSFMFSLTATR